MPGPSGGGGSSQSTTVTQSTTVNVSPQFFIDLSPVQKAIDAISGVQTRGLAALEDTLAALQGQGQRFDNALAAQMQWSLVIGVVGLLVMIYFQKKRR